MKGPWCFLVSLGLMITSSALGLQEDEYEDTIVYDEDSNEVLCDVMPEFITKNSTIFVDIGGSVTLPCQVKHEECFTRFWTRKNVKITLGNSVLTEVKCHQ